MNSIVHSSINGYFYAIFCINLLIWDPKRPYSVIRSLWFRLCSTRPRVFDRPRSDHRIKSSPVWGQQLELLLRMDIQGKFSSVNFLPSFLPWWCHNIRFRVTDGAAQGSACLSYSRSTCRIVHLILGVLRVLLSRVTTPAGHAVVTTRYNTSSVCCCSVTTPLQRAVVTKCYNTVTTL